jgi:hypothetical protein
MRTAMTTERAQPITVKRFVLLAVAGLLTAAAALAIGILLFGDFGSTEGRVLATTAVLAGYGLFTLPAAVLRDQRRAPVLAAAVVALAVAGASLAVASIWSDEPSDALGKALGTATGWLVAAVLPAALLLRRSDRDPRVVRLLFAASSTLVGVLALMLTVVLWAEIDSERFGRVFGALLVLDVLLVALQPILARARPGASPYRLRVRVETGGSFELVIEAPDLAAAAAKAIRAVERDPGGVVGLDVASAQSTRGEAAGR